MMNRLCLPALLFALLTLTGCQEEPQQFHVSGTVTFKGQPVPRGTIFFDPVPKQGGTAQQGIAEINNGKYDTHESDIGIQGGEYDIRILGFDGKVANEAPFGQALFTEYHTNKTLSAEDHKLDLEVSKK